MSPEQAAGDSDIDGRADLYALGCVCFEMLTGMPPFTGVNAQVVRMRHVAEPPPPIRTMRPTVPREIEEVVHRLMAKVPADRFPSAARLRDTLSTTTNEGKAVARSRRRWWQLGALVGILALVVGVVIGVRGIDSFTSLGGIEPDSTRYAVLPLMELVEDGPLPPDLSGERVARDMADALSAWRGIEVVRDFRVRDLLAQAGRPPRTMQASAGLARQLRAGVVIWGDVRAASGGADVRAVMYRSTDPDSVIAQHAVFVPAGGALRESMVALTAALLTNHGGTSRRAPGTTDFNAHTAFSDGHDALSEWELPRALKEFARAVELDPAYAEAHLWLALVQTWAGDDNPRPRAWHASARRAAELKNALPMSDRPYAVALGAMSEGRFDLACPMFDSLVTADSTSFEAWFGLADCLRNDRTVVPDTSSPSKYAFRASWERAITAYMKALELVPSMHRAFRGAAFDRLPNQMLFASPNIVRPGILVRGDQTLLFHAFAALQNDTIEFTPYLSDDLFNGRVGPPASAVAAAAARNRDRLRQVTEQWVDAFPSSADAREAFARALEGLGELAGSRDERHSALAQLGHARRLSTDSAQLLRLAGAEVRLFLKTEQFARAAQLSDSLLAKPTEDVTDISTLLGLAGLAALRGDAARSADFMRRAAPNYTFTTPKGNEWTMSRPVAEPALAYLAYAAVGAPADTLRALEDATRTSLDQFAPPERRMEFALATMLRPSMLAFPVTGATWIHGQGDQPTPLLTLQRMMVAGDTLALRARLDSYVVDRAAYRAGDVSIDQIYQEAELRLAIGDTVEATQLLDRSLSAIPTLGLELVHHVAESAALVRAMALRAALARHAGDRRIADRWGAAVAALRAPAAR
jgi:tetratricopeptide (TPR) repeat protein